LSSYLKLLSASSGGPTAYSKKDNVIGLHYHVTLPEVGIMEAIPTEMCADLGALMKARIQQHLRSGHTMDGHRFTPKESTLKRRRYDMKRPARQQEKRRVARKALMVGPLREREYRWKIKTGKYSMRSRMLRGRHIGYRFDRQFPGGPSKGGTQGLNSSGYMADNVNISVENGGSRVFVSLPFKRKVVEAYFRRRYGWQLLGIPSGDLDTYLDRACEGVLAPMGGGAGLARGVSGGRLIGGAILRGILQGAGL
jgi:hypothetical protein